MEILKEITEIDEFEGKRNCVLTIFIPPNIEFKKDITRIEKSIYNIKNEFKKEQLIPIIKKIKGKLSGKNKISGNGMIVCCGLSLHHNNVYYKDLLSNKIIDSFEYYYDYNFHTNRIMTYMLNNVCYLEPKFNKKVSHDLKQLLVKNRLIYPKKAKKWFDQNLVKTIYYLSPTAIPSELLQLSIDKKIQVIIHNGELTEMINKDLQYVGVLKVSLDLIQFI